MLLTQYFDVSQLSKIEVAFFLQTLDSQVQLLYLKKNTSLLLEKNCSVNRSFFSSEV